MFTGMFIILVYTYINICLHSCLHSCLLLFTYMLTHMFTDMLTLMFTHIFNLMFIHVYTCLHMFTHVYTCLRKCFHTFLHTSLHTCPCHTASRHLCWQGITVHQYKLISASADGVLAPGSAHARPSARPPIDTSGNFSAHIILPCFENWYLN
jgi:hypothetical protein